MEQSKPVATLFESRSKLINDIGGTDLFNREMHQSAVGSLLYLSPRKRPEFVDAFNAVARFSANPTKQHWYHLSEFLNI